MGSSPFSSAIVVAREHMLESGEMTEREGGSKGTGAKKREKRRNVVASPARNGTLPNAEEEGRSQNERELRADRDTHDARPHYGRERRVSVTQRRRCANPPRFAICRPASMRDTPCAI